jgi:hypothetical protein
MKEFLVLMGLFMWVWSFLAWLSRKELYCYQDSPYLLIKELNGKLFREKIEKFLTKGGKILKSEKEEKNMIEAVVTHKGQKIAEVLFFPEAIGLLNPAEFLAKISDTDVKKIKVFKANKKTVLSTGEYALVFDESAEIHVDDGYGAGFAAGYAAGRD